MNFPWVGGSCEAHALSRAGTKLKAALGELALNEELMNEGFGGTINGA